MDDDGKQGLEEDDLLDDAEVDTLIREVVVRTIGDSHFDRESASRWTSEILAECLKKLTALSKPFKYVVTCNLAEKASPQILA
jgi:dynein light chain Tctex-type 1